MEMSQKKTKRGRKQRREVINSSSWGVLKSADFDSFSEEENREREREKERVRPRSVF